MTTLADENYGHSHLHILYNIYKCLSEYKCNGEIKLLQHHSKPQYRNDDVHMIPGLQIIPQRAHMHIHTHVCTCMYTHKHPHMYAQKHICIYAYIYGHQYTNDIKNTQVIFDMPLSMWLCNITATSCINILCVCMIYVL